VVVGVLVVMFQKWVLSALSPANSVVPLALNVSEVIGLHQS